MSQSGSAAKPKAGHAMRQMIGFRLGPESFAIDISKIHEIIKPLPITVVPNVPAGFCGVIQLRDQVIVIADLHGRFGFRPTDQTKDTRIIVLEGSRRRIGIQVDAVSEVVRFSTGMIAPSPGFHNGGSADYIDGIGKLNGHLSTLLDVDALFPEPGGPAPACAPMPCAEIPATPASEPAAPETTSKEIMDQLGKQAQSGTALYHDLGELARYINMTHKQFAERMMVEESNIKVKAKDIPTAYDMLTAVTEETEAATMKVMSHTEETSGAVGEIRNLLDQMEEAVPASNEAAAKVSDLAERMRDELNTIEGLQGDTMITMSFQDLTGQKIKQVIALMAEVEERILKLVVEFGMEQAEKSEGAIEEKMRGLKTDPAATGVCQDGVDSILAEFGF
ncbi:MAG: protein phosphatase CheZ [Nitrospirae bacterium]|nr:protein phosphatase CheZ [Nitrospirota bacterium]